MGWSARIDHGDHVDHALTGVRCLIFSAKMVGDDVTVHINQLKPCNPTLPQIFLN